MTAVIVRYVEATLGAAGVEELLRRAGDERTLEEIADANGWSSYPQACALFEAARAVTDDPDVGLRVGEEMLRQHAGTEVAALLRSLGSPGELLRNIAATGAKFSTITEFDALHVGETSGKIATRTVGGFERHPLLCDYVAGLLSQVSVLFDLEQAAVVETECQRLGAPACVYEARWDPGSAVDVDPVRRIAQLEAQLAAMAERFESLQSTATELVSPGGVEPLLARIAQRAGLAVRAPQQVLAVRLPGEDHLRVHAEGLTGESLDRAVHEILESDLREQPGRLVVEVASAQHVYGRLAALYPADAPFFAEERRILTAYAAQAAAALDTATALRDLDRRNETARALLALAHELADVGSPSEVAQRVAATVSSVIDCESAAVFLWDPVAEHLDMRGSAGLAPDAERALASMPITRSDTPLLDAIIADHQPLFLDAEHPDAYARRILEIAGSAAAVVVPIAARGVFYGLVTAGVHAERERLRSSPEVLERLSGLAAQASAALGNATLLAEVNHRATHDVLTGLANRALFRERVGEALLQSSATARAVGVMLIDLDDFKHVNDTYGHAVGDDVLVATAERIRVAVRDTDVVCRLGGDEFAVLLPEVPDIDACAAVAEKIVASLRRPIVVDGDELTVTASVGIAVSAGLDAYDTLLRRADVAMYGAKSAGRDTMVAADEPVEDRRVPTHC